MHESRLALQIIQTAENCALENDAKRVKAVNLVVGEYSGCVAESIKLYFDLYAEGSLCENADFNIETVTPMLRCKTCGDLFKREPFTFRCTKENCDGEGEPTEIGREFYIHSVEIE